MTTQKTTYKQVKKMTDEKLKIKIAVILGWRNVGKQSTWSNTLVGIPPAVLAYNPVHDYTGSLDVMYDLEEIIGKEPINVLRYYQNLMFLLTHDAKGNDIFGGCAYWDTLHATARQRAETFVLTMEGN